jgi:osmotically-inducible protein OsmY
MLAAHQIAASFEGCRDVVNRLSVEPAAGIRDQEILGNVRAALDAHADITKSTITVSVAAGEVTLMGNVGSDSQRVLAEDVARSAQGVRDVTNLLVVDLAETTEDRQLRQQILEAVSQEPGLKDADVRIAFSGNAIVLSGEVAKLWHKTAAKAVVRRFWHREVRNDIAVTGC